MTLDYQLGENQVAILWYETREVQILTIPNLSDQLEHLGMDDVGYFLETHMEYDLSNAYYMT